eukprot:12117576-Prorocentrum_lima.AAC.1
MLMTWRSAQKRGQEVGIPALGGNERFTLLVKMISQMEKEALSIVSQSGNCQIFQGGKNALSGNCKTVGRGDHGRIDNAGSR